MRAKAANDVRARGVRKARPPAPFAFAIDCLRQKQAQLAGFAQAATRVADRLRFQARIDEINAAIEKLGGDA